jgi:hypothetical protein
MGDPIRRRRNRRVQGKVLELADEAAALTAVAAFGSKHTPASSKELGRDGRWRIKCNAVLSAKCDPNKFGDYRE